MQISFLSLLTLTGSAAAWYGQLNAGELQYGEGGPYQQVSLTDYNTGSHYGGVLSGGWGPNGVNTYFLEDSQAYWFYASLWQTSDGCYNIDFEGAFGGAGHGYCCDGLPCDIGA